MHDSKFSEKSAVKSLWNYWTKFSFNGNYLSICKFAQKLHQGYFQKLATFLMKFKHHGMILYAKVSNAELQILVKFSRCCLNQETVTQNLFSRSAQLAQKNGLSGNVIFGMQYAYKTTGIE